MMRKIDIKLKNILLLCKKSAYELYFLKHKDQFRNVKYSIDNEIKKFKRIHIEHYKSLLIIEEILNKYRIKYKKIFRGTRIDYKRFTLIITVGGDGTLLEANRNITNQPIIGVNSSPSSSVGKLCECQRAEEIEIFIDKILNKRIKYSKIYRIRLKLSNSQQYYDVLNDILICHKNPASMSRYSINLGGITERHKNSGIWIATAIGSSGAIHSAGGKIINKNKQLFQYLPRELYKASHIKYLLTGDILDKNQKIKIKSFMRNGKIYIDGPHLSIPFPLGTVASIYISPKLLATISL